MSTTFGLVEKLSSGQSITIQATGDSTVYGAYDTAMSGWVGRLGIAFGNAFNATVTCTQYNGYGGYNPAVTLRTGSGSTQVILRDAGVPSWQTPQVTGSLTAMLNVTNIDVIIHGTGFNDINVGTTPTQFVTNIRQLISGIKAKSPSVPIIITTENVANSSSYDAAFNAMANDLVGQSLPLSPPLLASTTVSGVFLMDTRQAYGNTWQSNLMSDYLHPNSAGYQAQASWMYGLLGDTAGGGGSRITTTTGTAAVIRQTPVLLANWQIGNTFTASNENTVGATINLLNAAVAQLGGPTLPNVPTNFDVGVTFTAESANTVGSAINTLGNVVANLGGGALTPVKANWQPGAQFNYSDQNSVESAINALGVSIALLQSK